jgi:DNA polymerase III sliding clamp (beta) subunit (PCNA family)
MKIQINKNILFNALKINCSLIDSSSFNPIADAVLIIASSQNIKIINTNNYLSCLVEIKENFTCEQSGEVLIKAKILFNVVSKLSNQTIDIEVVDNSVIRITQSKFISDINLLDKSLFSVPNFNHDS